CFGLSRELLSGELHHSLWRVRATAIISSGGPSKSNRPGVAQSINSSYPNHFLPGLLLGLPLTRRVFEMIQKAVVSTDLASLRLRDACPPRSIARSPSSVVELASAAGLPRAKHLARPAGRATVASTPSEAHPVQASRRWSVESVTIPGTRAQALHQKSSPSLTGPESLRQPASTLAASTNYPKTANKTARRTTTNRRSVLRPDSRAAIQNRADSTASSTARAANPD